MTPATVAPPFVPSPYSGNGTVAHPTLVVAASQGWTPHRWSIESYRELYKTGLFNDKKTMLVNGVLYVMTMPNPPHDASLTFAFDLLRPICPAGHYIRNQQGFDIGSEDDPGPDLAIVPGSARDYTTRTPTKAIMIVEVSDSTLFFDTTTKAELYATAGVPEYWVIDINNRQLHVYRDPVGLPKGLGATAYRKFVVYAESESVSPLAAPAANIRVADLLP
jgi:Uma2 family endonuclease